MADRDEHSTIEDILGDAAPRETSLQVCVAGDLAGQLDALLASRAGVARTSLAGEGIGELETEIAAVRARMAERTHTFTFRALTGKAWSDLLAAHPSPTKDRVFDVETFPAALVSACCRAPEMDLDQTTRLFDSLNEGGRQALFEAAWGVNTGAVPVPLSASI